MRTSAEKTRAAIRHAATETFCERGYRASTLEEIGARVGLTRGSVLHHFSSKAGLLSAVTEPYLHDLAQLIRAAVAEAPTDDRRRQMLADLLDLFVEHQGAMRLLTNDLGARAELDRPDHLQALRSALVTALFGPNPTIHDEVRAAVALGGVCQPAAGGWLDLEDRSIRDDLVGAALAVTGAGAADHDGTPEAAVAVAE